MCDSMRWPDWKVRCVEQALSLDNVELKLIILPAQGPVNSGASLSRIGRAREEKSTLAYRLFQKFFRPRTLAPVDVSRRFQSVPKLEWLPEPPPLEKGRGSPPDDLAEKAVLDFVLDFSGSEQAVSEIAESVRLGVWSYHSPGRSGHECELRSFWDIYHANSISGARLHQKTSKGGGDIVLREANYRTISYSYVRNVDHVQAKASAWVKDACRDILEKGDVPPRSNPRAPDPDSLALPRNLQVLRLCWRLLKNRISKLVHDSVMVEQWNIGLVRRPIKDLIEGAASLTPEWLLAPSKTQVFADPFPVLSREPHVLFESFNRDQDKGSISVTTLDAPRGHRAVRVCLEKPHHLSYPFVFEHEGGVYMIPEEWLSNRITLYKAAPFPSGWQPVSILVDDIAAVDATLFRHGGFWWLFCSPREDEFTASLLIFFAESPFGPWQPHESNPVKCDIRNSRPAGSLFHYNGMLIRPTQDSSESYGRRISLNRVVELSPGRFQEDTIKTLKPEPGERYDRGIHTINPLDDVVVIDGKRYFFSLLPLKQIFRKAFPRSPSAGGCSESFQIISAPMVRDRSDYGAAVGAVTDALRRIPGIAALFQLGGTDSPGISDIDLLAVFEDSARVDFDAAGLLAAHDKYLFTHNVSGISKSDFLTGGEFDVWYSARRLWGEALRPDSRGLGPGEREAVRRQTALEFLVENYIDLTIQRRYGVLKLRSTLQHVKAIRLDLELLGISSGPVFDMVQQVRRWLGRWFECPIRKLDIWNWMKSFYIELEALLSAELAKSPLFLPEDANLRFSRNITLRQGEFLKNSSSGVSVPPHIIGVQKRLFNLNTRLNSFVFDVPFTHRTSLRCLEDRYAYYRKIKRTGLAFWPRFDPFITGFSAKIIA
jgi:hypothetical protein